MSQPLHFASSNCSCFNCQVASGNDDFDPNNDLTGWSRYHERQSPPPAPAAEEGEEEEEEEGDDEEDESDETASHENESDEHNSNNGEPSDDEDEEGNTEDDEDDRSAQVAPAPPPNLIGTTTDSAGRSRRFARAGHVYQCFHPNCSYVNRDAHEFSGRHLRAWHTRGTETAEQIQGRLMLVTEARGRELQPEWMRWRNQQQGRGRRR